MPLGHCYLKKNITLNLFHVVSVLFWLNFSLAKMLKNRLEDEEDRKDISLPEFQAKKQLDAGSLEEEK